jgi:hypothetical protein
MKFPIVPMTKRHILNARLMLAENAVSMTTGHADKLNLSSSVPVPNPCTLNSFAELELHCFDSFTLTEGELRSIGVRASEANLGRSSSRHPPKRDTESSQTPGFPAPPRGSVETGVCHRPALAPSTLNTLPARTVRKARAYFDTFAARTRCVTVYRSRSFNPTSGCPIPPKGCGQPGTSSCRFQTKPNHASSRVGPASRP